jgi:hypothetical protein
MRSGRWGGEPLLIDEFAYMVLAKLHGQRLLRGADDHPPIYTILTDTIRWIA